MKIQMKFQKIICLVMILVGALLAIHTFAYTTGSLELLGEPITGTTNWQAPASFPMSQLYLDVQPFNQTMFILSVLVIVAGCLLYITATNKRRKYYITNIIATGVCAVFDIVVAIYALVENTIFRSQFLALDFDAWQAFVDDPSNFGKYSMSTSTVMFDLGYVVYLLVIVAAALLIFNLFWKFKCQKEEQKLLDGSYVAAGEVA
jgi:hypothetical protein